MCRSYGTLGWDALFYNGLKSVATICFVPTELLNGTYNFVINEDTSLRKDFFDEVREKSVSF